MPDQRTSTDRLIARLKDNRILSVVIVCAVILTGAAAVLNALLDIKSFFDRDGPELAGKAPAHTSEEAPEVSATSPADSATDEGIAIGDNTVVFNGAGRLTNLQGYDPAWSRDSKVIVYCSRNYKGEGRLGSDLLLSRDNGTTGTLLHSSGTPKFQPQLSFDGDYVAFLAADWDSNATWRGRGSLWIMPTAGGEPLRVSDPDGLVVIDLNHVTNLDWSPVRSEVAYVLEESVGGRTLFGLYVYDVRSNRRRLLHRADPEADFGELWQGRALRLPQWSPDGQRLGVLYGGGGENLFLYVDVESRATQKVAVSASTSFDWYDSDTIVYDAGGAGEYRLAMYEIDSGETRYLSRYEYFTNPVVTPATGIVYFSARFELPGGRWRHVVYVQRTPNDETRPIVETVNSDFYGPVAQPFGEDADAGPKFAIPSRFLLDNSGQRGLYNIEKNIYVIELPPR